MARSVQVFALSAFAIGFGFASADPLQDIAQCSQISSGEMRLICYDAAASALKSLPPATAPIPQATSTVSAPQTQAEAMAPMPAPPVPVAPPAITQPAAKEVKSKGWIPTFGLFGGKKKEAPAEVAATQSPATSPEATFGADRLPKPKERDEDTPKPVSEIKAAVTDYAFTPFNRIIVFLDNGQVWRQIDGDTTVVRLRKEQAHTAEIDKGLLGSYNMSIDGKRTVKVTRIK